MRSRRISSIQQIAPAAWDRCFDGGSPGGGGADGGNSDVGNPIGNPFIRHAYLAALESSRSVCAEAGWAPAHLLLEDDSGSLVGAMPAYRKTHSWGEFVFDWAWAEACQRLGADYYPKKLSAVPFTPVPGPRIGARSEAARQALAEAFFADGEAAGCSSAHVLFAEDEDLAALAAQGYLLREDLRFHWHNRGYADFDDFLAALNSDRRKKIRRERRRVREAGIAFDTLPGDALDDATWDRVYRLYASTYQVRGQRPYLSEAFWQSYGRAPQTPVRVTLARCDGRIIACALFVEGAGTLYGRHWGSEADYHSLHFECCYYQGIDYCIRHRLEDFDAGVQGSHKLLRGFDPVITRSAHRLRDPRLQAAVADFLRRERSAVAEGRERLRQHTAWRKDTAGAPRSALK